MGYTGFFIYNDTEPPMQFKGGGFKNVDPNPQYIKHYGNYLHLSFICRSTPDWMERKQAEKELAICEKKLDWWSKRGGFEFKSCLQAIQELKRQWEVPNQIDRWS